MSDFLPWFFLVLAGGALLTAIAQLWASFHAAFGGADDEVEGYVHAASRRALLEEKETLLRQLQELRFDRDANKMSEADFQELDAALRERAKKVLRLLDADIAPFRAAAEERVREHLGISGSPYRGTSKPARPAEDDEEADASEMSLKDIMKRKRTRGDEATRDFDDAEALDDGEVDAETKDCPDCETVNDADAVFCKKCGHRFDVDEHDDHDHDEDEDEDELDEDAEGEEANP